MTASADVAGWLVVRKFSTRPHNLYTHDDFVPSKYTQRLRDPCCFDTTQVKSTRTYDNMLHVSIT